jgi:nucleoside-diphosphate-sugar epimerase
MSKNEALLRTNYAKCTEKGIAPLRTLMRMGYQVYLSATAWSYRQPDFSSMPLNILVLGATGFVGRNLVNSLRAAYADANIQAVDKKHWKLVHMSDQHSAGFEDQLTKFVQADCSKERSMEKVFAIEAGSSWDLVVNLTSETAHGSQPSAYEERCHNTAVLCATTAAALATPPKLYVDFSTALVYASGYREAADEAADLKPWTLEAEWKLKGEQAVEALSLSSLNRVVFRPAYIYGKGDTTSLMPRAVCAATYVGTSEKMKFLWDGGLKLNTVHVDDVCAAVKHAFTNFETMGGKTYNLCDEGDTDNQLANGLIGTIFGIQVGFHGKLISNVARLNLEAVCETANDKHVEPWGKICREKNVDTVLSPFIHKELLGNNHLYVDGSKISEETGFVYSVPRLTEEKMREMIMAAVDSRIFPDFFE